MPSVYGTIKLELAETTGMRSATRRTLASTATCASPTSWTPGAAQGYLCGAPGPGAGREELALVNMYIGMAMNRSRLTEILGALLATETMIQPLRGVADPGLAPRGHGDRSRWRTTWSTPRWTWSTPTPGWTKSSSRCSRATTAAMPELVLGIMLRLDAAGAVVDRLYDHVKGVGVLSAPTVAHKVP